MKPTDGFCERQTVSGFIVAKINGKQVYELVKNYLADADENFYVTNKYELPIASGMKIIVNQAESGFSLKDLTVNDKKIDKEKEYSILLTDTTMSVLKKINPKCEIEQLKETTLSSAWIEAMSKGLSGLYCLHSAVGVGGGI